MEPTGIVVIGSPRSGTTLLRRVLDAHPNIACPPETYLLAAAARFLHDDRFAAGLRIGVLDGLSFAGFAEEETLTRLRDFAFGFLDEYARKAGKTRWAEKTAFNAFHLAAIRKFCGGHVKFVCIQRHGLDVAVSMKDLVEKTGGFVQELHEYLRRYPEPLEAFARSWVDTANEIATLADEDENAMSLRYEDLTADPQKELGRVFEFLGEPWNDELLGDALKGTGRVGFGDWKTYSRGSVDNASVGRWASLPTPVQARLAEICDPTLLRLGYDPVAVEAVEQDPEEVRRRYEMGLMFNRMKLKE